MKNEHKMSRFVKSSVYFAEIMDKHLRGFEVIQLFSYQCFLNSKTNQNKSCVSKHLPRMPKV